MQSWLLNGGFIEKKRDPTVEVPLHEVAEMHAWEASGAGMRSSLQFHGGQCGYSHTFARNGCWCCMHIDALGTTMCSCKNNACMGSQRCRHSALIAEWGVD